MFKLLMLLIVFAGVGGFGYWYGYNNGKMDAGANSDGRSLESATSQYVDKIKGIEVNYKDKDGNIVIPKVKWDELKNSGK